MSGKTSYARVRRGLTLIETALVLGVLSLVVGGLAEVLAQQAETGRTKSAAIRLNEVTQAAAQYIAAYNSQLLICTTNGPVEIPVGVTTAGGAQVSGPTCSGVSSPSPMPSLQSGGFLPATFIDSNAYGQSSALIVQQMQATGETQAHLEAMVTTVGGTIIPDRQLGRAASLLGSEGGFMLSQTDGPLLNSVVYGVGGGWQASPAGWSTAAATPTSGHIMAILGTNDTFSTGQYLSRVDTGNPEDNTMRTNILMNGNSLTSVNSVCADSNCSDLNQTLDIGPNIEVPGQINAGGNIISNSNILGQDITAEKNFIAPNGDAFVASYCDINGCSYNVTPAGSSNLKDLQTQSLSMDTVIYSTNVNSSWGNSPNKTNGVTLADLLPHYVAQAGWIASAQQGLDQVPYPTCNNEGVPKIILSPLEETMAFTAAVNWDYAQGGDQIGTGYDPYTDSYDIPVIVSMPILADQGLPQQIMTGFTPVDHGTYAAKNLSATDNNGGVSPLGTPEVNGWTVNFSGSPDVPGYVSSAQAETYCYYP